MSNQTSEAFAYIEREYIHIKGRVELQRRVVEQLHMVEADAGPNQKRVLLEFQKLLEPEAGATKCCASHHRPYGGRTRE